MRDFSSDVCNFVMNSVNFGTPVLTGDVSPISTKKIVI